MFFSKQRKYVRPPFSPLSPLCCSPHLEHMHHVLIALCSQSGQLHWLAIPKISSIPTYAPHAHPCMHTLRGHKSPSLHHLPPPKHTHTCTHVIAALVLPSLPSWFSASELTLLLYYPPTPSSSIRSSVTTAVCQLSARPSLVKDEVETQRVHREDCLASLSLPAVTPTSDFHLSQVFFRPCRFTTRRLFQTR